MFWQGLVLMCTAVCAPMNQGQIVALHNSFKSAPVSRLRYRKFDEINLTKGYIAGYQEKSHIKKDLVENKAMLFLSSSKDLGVLALAPIAFPDGVAGYTFKKKNAVFSWGPPHHPTPSKQLWWRGGDRIQKARQAISVLSKRFFYKHLLPLLNYSSSAIAHFWYQCQKYSSQEVFIKKTALYSFFVFSSAFLVLCSFAIIATHSRYRYSIAFLFSLLARTRILFWHV